jgi:DNA-3-methyladenine glycosylase
VASSKRFKRAFFRRSAVDVAREMLGCYLHRKLESGVELVGKIVETEAYTMTDPSCHAYKGKTPRTEHLFGDAGYSYIYFTYGTYWCLNVVANEEEQGEAILIRGIEPIIGIEEMRKRRPAAKKDKDLTNGPGKICLAFDLDKHENKLDIIDGDVLWLTKGEMGKSFDLGVSSRIGISVAQDYPWRFYVKGNPYVSPGKLSAPHVNY